MKARNKLCAATFAGMAGGLALSPVYVKQAMTGFAYGLGMRNLQLEGIARLVATLVSHADHPPIFCQMPEHAQYIAKVPPKEYYYTNPEKMIEAFRRVGAWYGMDFPLAATDAYVNEAEAMGAKMIYSDVDMPTIDFTDPLIKEPRDLDRVVDFSIDSGRLRYLAAAVAAFPEAGLPALVPCCAPFSLAVAVRSYPKLIRDMRKDPKFAHELFTWITDVVQPHFLKVLNKATGARIAMAADAWAAFPNLTLDMLEDWVVPYNARYRKNSMRKGFAVLPVAAADYCEENPDRFDRATMEACWRELARTTMGTRIQKGIPIGLMGRTMEWPLEWLQDYAMKNRVPLYGKRPIILSFNARFLREGPAETIVEWVKKIIDQCGREGRLVPFIAQIPAATPPEHIHAAVAAIKTYGRYPIAENLDDVKFEMPEFEPFEVWLKKQ